MNFNKISSTYEIDINSIPQIVFVFDTDGNVIYMSKKYYDYTGCTIETMKSSAWGISLHPDDIKSITEIREKSLKEGSPHSIEYRLRSANGEYHWFLSRSEPIRNKDGNIVNWVGCAWDINEKKTLEIFLEAKEKEQDNLLNIIQNISDGFVVIDKDSKIAFMNTVAEDILALKSSDIIGKNIYEEFASKVSTSKFFKNYEDCVSEQKTIQYKVYYEKQDRTLSYTLYPSTYGVFVYISEVTEKYRFARDLEKEKIRYEFLANNVLLMIYTADADGSVNYYNKRWEDYTGYDTSQCTNWNWIPLIHKDDIKNCLRIYRDAIEKGEEYQVEVRLKRHDGVYRWHLYRGLPMRDKNGKVNQWVGTGTDIDDQKKLAEKLEESDERYSSLFRNSPDAIYSFDLDGNFISANSVVEDISGYSPDEIIGMNFHSMIVPEKLESTIAIFKETLATNKPSRLETTIFNKFGKRVEVDVTNIPINVGGKTVGCYGISKNITEEKKKSEIVSRLASIVEFTSDAILTKDLEGKIITWNLSAEKLYGYSANEIIGKNVSIILPEDRKNEMEIASNAVMRGDKFENYQTRRRRKDGILIDVSVTISPIKNSKGEIVLFSSIVKDLTAQKNAERKLKIAEKRREAILSVALDAIISINTDSVIIELNKSAETMFCYTRDEMLGKTLTETIIPERYRLSHQEGMKHFFTTGESVVLNNRIEIEAMRKGGEEFPIELAIIPLDFDGETLFTGYIRDITERKASEIKEKIEIEAKNKFVKDVIFSVTEGRLSFAESENNLPNKVGDLLEAYELNRNKLSFIRETIVKLSVSLGFQQERVATCVGEGLMNAVVHAEGGIVSLYASDKLLQIWIRDEGKGIKFDTIPYAVLRSGWSSAGTLGMGFVLMLSMASHLDMLTGETGTTLVITIDKERVIPFENTVMNRI